MRVAILECGQETTEAKGEENRKEQSQSVQLYQPVIISHNMVVSSTDATQDIDRFFACQLGVRIPMAPNRERNSEK